MSRLRSLWWLAFPALLVAVGILKRPRSQPPTHRAEWLAAGSADVRVVQAGSGEPTLLLLHGFGESLFTWRAIFDRLARDHRVIALDLPGFGGSAKPDTAYTVASMTGRLAAFLDRWTAGPVVVVGHSMGGELAAELALARPDRIGALVLIAPSGWSVGLGGIADTMYPSKAKAIGWYLSSRAFLLPEHDPDWLAEPADRANYSLVTDPAYRAVAARVLQDFDFTALRNRFGAIRQPVQLIWGELDPVIPFSVADSIRAQLPCGRLTSFATALHRPQVEIPDTTSALILNFVARPECLPSIPQ